MLKFVAGGMAGLLERGRQLVAPAPQDEGVDERRLNKRQVLSVPVQVRIGNGRPRRCRTVDVNTHGFAVALSEAERGDEVCVTFEAIPTVVPQFVLRGHVVRVAHEVAGIKVDRRESDGAGLNCYRQMMIHFLRHRPLMEDIASGYLEARCTSCGWVGRVGRRQPTCSACGGTVERVRE